MALNMEESNESWADAPPKRKPKSTTNLNGDDNPAKPKPVKKKKKSSTEGGGGSTKKKKSNNTDENNGSGGVKKPPSSVKKKKPSLSTVDNNDTNKVPASPAKPTSMRVVPRPSATDGSDSPARPKSMRVIPRPTASNSAGSNKGSGGGNRMPPPPNPGARAPTPPTMAESNGAAGRSSRNMNGGRGGRGSGRGRGGRGAPSSRNIGRNASYDGAAAAPPRQPPSSRNIGRNASYDTPRKPTSFAAPRRPQSMAQLPGVPDNDNVVRKPQSMMGGFGRNGGGGASTRASLGQVGSSHRGRAPFGRGMKPMGKNAVSNRNLPPPPGTRGKSKRSLLGSLHGRSSHHVPPPKKTSPRPMENDDNDDDDDDDGEEFANDDYGSDDNSDLSAELLKGPESILRKSSRAQPTSRRMNVDGSISLSHHSTNFSIDEDEDYAGEDDFAEAEPMVNRMPSTQPRKNGLKKPGLGLNETEHSMRGWTQSFKWNPIRNKNNRNDDKQERRGMLSDHGASKSVRSLLTIDMEFEEEPIWKQWLRYIRILAPHPDEKPIKRNIRIFNWVAMGLDFLTALVSITTFDSVSYCCGDPILSIAGDINWDAAIQVTVYLYIVLIFAEIIPVMREGFPFFLANPFFGFLITFGMFFDDRILEAVVMWIIEASAVLCEFWVYRLKMKWHNQRGERLQKAENDLKALRKERKRRKLSGGSMHSMDSVSSDLSFDERSFHDESNGSSRSSLTKEPPAPKDVSQIRETRILRERRLLRQAQSDDRRKLRYHFAGVAFNIGLVVISLLLIVMVGRSGGLCIVDMIAPNVFKTNQLEKCFDCKGVDGVCEVCRDDGTSHCYYPYY